MLWRRDSSREVFRQQHFSVPSTAHRDSLKVIMAARPSRHLSRVSSLSMTRIKPGGKSESDRRSATVSAVTARPRSTLTLMSSGTRPRHARNWSELWSLYRMSYVTVHRPCRGKPLVPRLTAVLILIKCAVVLHENARPRQGADCSLANTSSIGDCPESAGSWQSFMLSANGNDAPFNSFQWQRTAGAMRP